jgi:hypothetical protein
LSFARGAAAGLLVCCGLAAGVAVCEVGLRVFKLWEIPDYSQVNWYRKPPIPGVPYLLKPNLRAAWGLGNVATDDFGIRNQHPAERPAGIYRILALGDSVTFGFGVDRSQSFPAVLEKLLNGGGAAQYQVIDAGVPGFNIRDEAALLPELLRRYRPGLVLWTVVSNDYDDSLGVDSEGRLTTSNIDRVIDVSQISNWGYDGRPVIDVEDFRRSMLPAYRSLPEGVDRPPPDGNSLDIWLKAHSFTYSFLLNRAVPGFPSIPTARKPTEAELLGKYTGSDGRSYLMQFFSAVFSSRRAIEAANRAIEQAQALGAEMHVPIVLVNDGLPMDARWMDSHAAYQELADYLGESPVDFFFRRNLGWDSHPSPAGNRKIAGALWRMLGCRGFVPRNGDCQAAQAFGVEMRDMWAEFDRRRKRFVAEHYGPIDFDRFQGIHQVLGGIFRSRMFPGPVARRAAVLVPVKDEPSLVVTGTLAGAVPAQIRLTVFAGEQSVSRDWTVPPGDARLGIGIAPLPANAGGLVELQLECLGETCPPMRLHRIAAERYNLDAPIVRP